MPNLLHEKARSVWTADIVSGRLMKANSSTSSWLALPMLNSDHCIYH